MRPQLKLAVLRVATPVQFAQATIAAYPCCVDVLSLLRCAVERVWKTVWRRAVLCSLVGSVASWSLEAARAPCTCRDAELLSVPRQKCPPMRF